MEDKPTEAEGIEKGEKINQTKPRQEEDEIDTRTEKEEGIKEEEETEQTKPRREEEETEEMTMKTRDDKGEEEEEGEEIYHDAIGEERRTEENLGIET